MNLTDSVPSICSHKVFISYSCAPLKNGQIISKHGLVQPILAFMIMLQVMQLLHTHASCFSKDVDVVQLDEFSDLPQAKMPTVYLSRSA